MTSFALITQVKTYIILNIQKVCTQNCDKVQIHEISTENWLPFSDGLEPGGPGAAIQTNHYYAWNTIILTASNVMYFWSLVVLSALAALPRCKPWLQL